MTPIAPPFASAGASRAVTFLTRGRLAVAVTSLAATAFFSFPAAADEYRFGGSVLTFDGREVVFHNGPSPAPPTVPREFHHDLTHGLTVRVVVMHGVGLGNPPDTVHVIPPAGYIAVPETLTVEEYGRGVIVIYTDGLS